jgi:hypothetical protein
MEPQPFQRVLQNHLLMFMTSDPSKLAPPYCLFTQILTPTWRISVACKTLLSKIIDLLRMNFARKLRGKQTKQKSSKKL